MAQFELTVYQADGVTEDFSVGTDPAHARPYLQVPEFSEAEIDLLNGRSRIARATATLIDPQDGATKYDRAVTALLGGATGQSRINGRRIRLRQVAPTAALIVDGIGTGKKLEENFVEFAISIDDVRARGIKLPLFSRTGTSTVFPRGVLNGFGLLPNGQWLIPPTAPLRGKFAHMGLVSNWGVINLRNYWKSWKNKDVRPEHVFTPAMASVNRSRNDTKNLDVASVIRWPHLQVLWRAVGDIGWNVVNELTIESVTEGLEIFGTEPGHLLTKDGEAVTGVTQVAVGSILGETLPAHDQEVEFIVVYTGPASREYPFHYEGTAGELLRNTYRGDYTTTADGILLSSQMRYDESKLVGVGAVPALRTPVLLRITEPVEDAREWTEDVHKALGTAPALDADGQISPVGAQLPDGTVTLASINDNNAEAVAGWEQSTDDAYTQVELTYPRYYRVPVENDPTGSDSDGDGLASVDQPITIKPDDPTIQALVGVKTHKLPGFLFGALGGTDGRPISGDVRNETGYLNAVRRGHEVIDRSAFGGQHRMVKVRRSDATMEAIRVGDWAIDTCSWPPNLSTGKRGRNHLVQVVSVKNLNDAWREMRLLDAAPHANPVGQPTIGAVGFTASGALSVEISALAVGSQGRVDFAISPTEPDANSGLWTYMGRAATVPTTLVSPVLPSGGTIWIRARGEKEGRRPSGWTATMQVIAPTVPRVTYVKLDLDESGVPSVDWNVNLDTGGVRVRYAVHGTTGVPPLVTYIDHASSDRPLVLPVIVGYGESVSVEVEGWQLFSGGAVGGTQGDGLSRTTSRAASSLAFGVSDVKEVPPSIPGGRRWEWVTGGGVFRVFVGYKKFFNQGVLTEDQWAQIRVATTALPAGQNWFEIAAADLPGPDEDGGIQIEPRKSDMTVDPGVRIWRIPVHAKTVQPPTVRPRHATNADGTTTDIYVLVTSEYEQVGLRAKGILGDIYTLVAGSADTTFRYVSTGTEIGPTDWFWPGFGSPVQFFNDVALTRDQIDSIEVQAYGERSTTTSDWVPVTLESRRQPWLEFAEGVFDEATNKLRVKGIGGAHSFSATFQISDDPTFSTGVTQQSVVFTDGFTHVLERAIVAADRRKTFYWRIRLYNGALLGGIPTGLEGVGASGEVTVPPAPAPVVHLYRTDGSSNLTSDIHSVIDADADAGDVILKLWTNKAGTANADPSGAPDATLTILNSALPAERGPAESTVLDDVPVWPGRGKIVYYQATSAEGGDTGVQPFTLTSALDIIGVDGKLIAGAIEQPAQFAASLRPLEIFATRPTTGSYLGHRVAAQDTGLAWEWNGTTWTALTGGMGFSYIPFVVAGSVTAREIAAAQIYATHLNVASVYLEGMTIVASGAGSITWSASTLTFQGQQYAIGIGSAIAGEEVVWWKNLAGSRNVFQKSTAAGLTADGFDEVRGDAIIAMNEGGTPRLVWNGTRIYGGMITTNAITARTLSAMNIEVSKYLRSASYSAGTSGWTIEGNGNAEFNNVTIRGVIKVRDGTGDEIQFVTTGGTTFMGISADASTVDGVSYNFAYFNGVSAGTIFMIGESGGTDAMVMVNGSLRIVKTFNENRMIRAIAGMTLYEINSLAGFSANYNRTSLRLWWLDAGGTYERDVKVGANGTGPGGVGRMLYFDN